MKVPKKNFIVKKIESRMYDFMNNGQIMLQISLFEKNKKGGKVFPAFLFKVFTYHKNLTTASFAVIRIIQ